VRICYAVCDEKNPGDRVMIIAVASGKGGTGKTTVAINLAKVFGSPVHLLDCDVEEPNARLFLQGTQRTEEPVIVLLPEVDASLCTACGACSELCAYNAIVSLKTVPLVFPELCHSCGGCALVCPVAAIHEIDRRIGVVRTFESGRITLVEGRIDVGVTMAPPVIKAVKSHLSDDLPAILDAPPGTSCSVIETVRGVDFVVLVTEPTPFGLHDLKLTVGMLQKLRIPFGVVVNRVGIGDNRVHSYCSENGISLLGEIPDDRRIAQAYSRGELIVDALPEYSQIFEHILNATVKEIACCSG